MAETRTLTLADFLLSQIADDEMHARAVVGEEAYPGETRLRIARIGRHDALGITAARALDECEAKRRILALHESGEAWCDYCSGWYGPDPAAECPTLRLLALPYAEHPDFRDEWRMLP